MTLERGDPHPVAERASLDPARARPVAPAPHEAHRRVRADRWSLQVIAVGLAASFALALAGCGGGGDGGEDSVPKASYDITAGEFITALAPEKLKILRDYVANEPNDCPEVDDSLLISASVDATEVASDAPFEEVMADTCGG